MNLEELNKIAGKMVAPGKGILAADESTGTIQKRFDAIGVANTEDNRRDYREMLFRADKTMREHISGVILFDETIRQKAKDGTTLVALIEAAGRGPRLKGDAGGKPPAGGPPDSNPQRCGGLAEQRGRSRGTYYQSAQALRAGRRAGHRLPVGRPVRRRGHRASFGDECHRQSALAAHLLLWPRPAGGAAKGMEWQDRECRCRPGRLRPSRADEFAGLAGQVEAGGRESCLIVDPLRFQFPLG